MKLLKENRRLILAIILINIFNLLINTVASSSNIFTEWYAVHIFPIYVNTLGRFNSLFPFSVYEFILYALGIFIIFLIIYIVYFFISNIKSLNVFFKRLFKIVMVIITFASSIWLMLTLTDTINYKRVPFSEYAGYTAEPASTDDLISLCNYLVSELNVYALEISVDDNGLCKCDVDLNSTAIEAMKTLGDTYSTLSGYYPNPKPVTLSHYMSYLNLTGMYSPFTIEANYNNDVCDYVVAETICHELSHVKGYIREDEANFISYLACISSDSSYFNYSGTMMAMSYSLRALRSAGLTDEYSRIYSLLPEQVVRDYRANSEYWNYFEGNVSTIATSANNAYLNANGQEGGIQSYGHMVDLLLSWYKTK